MEIDYKKLLKLYCGKSFQEFIGNQGDDAYIINFENKNLILNSWIFFPPKKDELANALKKFVKAFDIVYEFTDKNNNGVIVDFDFDKVLVYYINIENSIDSIQKIANAMKENLKDVEFFSTLHSGVVYDGNWGSKSRFKRMIFGSEVDYVKKINTIEVTNNINFIASESYKKICNQSLSFKEIQENGNVTFQGKNKGKLYEITFPSKH